MKIRAYLTIFVSTIVAMSLNFSTAVGLSTNIPVDPTQTSPPVNDLCKSQYMPVTKDASKDYIVKTIVNDIAVVTTNYEYVHYYGDRDSFSVTIRLKKKVGYPVHESWRCTNSGLVRVAIREGDFLTFFTGKDGHSTVQTTDWCVDGVTLPVKINTGDTWTQQTDFEFTTGDLRGWKWVKWKILEQPVDSHLPLLAGSGRFVYSYKAVGLEEVFVPAGTFQAIRVDVTAEGYIDPSHDLGPIIENTATGYQVCHKNENPVHGVSPEMRLTFKGSIWLAPVIGRVKQVGTLSGLHGEIESYEMGLRSFGR